MKALKHLCRIDSNDGNDTDESDISDDSDDSNGSDVACSSDEGQYTTIQDCDLSELTISGVPQFTKGGSKAFERTKTNCSRILRTLSCIQRIFFGQCR